MMTEASTEPTVVVQAVTDVQVHARAYAATAAEVMSEASTEPAVRVKAVAVAQVHAHASPQRRR